MIETVIFDMDGLLIDSEPFWQKAEKIAFEKVGISLTAEMMNRTLGMRIDEVIKYWYNRYPWDNIALKSVELDILAQMQDLIENEGKTLDGVDTILDFFTKKKIGIALASSSPYGLIQSVVETLKIERKFKVLCSAEYEEYGKPHPAVFIAAAKYMKTNLENCLVFEDSVNGVIAAKAAKMKCVAIPAPEDFDKKEFAIADLKLQSLADFDDKHLSLLNEI